ncbi:MAG: acyl-ACP--UDP-N-acetylglucosamine O-acyltransferase [Nitrospiraceae bacterium]|nr:acyl-ACP--UDP-N-acetylglucosamine O-acyltransferase [Nitrospiraceae bacterium]MDA8326071.1 acyl-ACP--UDP-N-acetylglucosamine O-acyltransferase [Nitrospiraceae bacterium]
MKIHPTAIVHEKATISRDASIGPYCVIGEGVRISQGVKLFNNVVVEGDTEIGPGSVIYPFAYIGGPPQDLKYDGEKTGVRVGRGNTIREYVTIHRGSVGGDGFTTIGDNNFIMAYAHIAHDCRIGSSVIMANAVTIGGHVEVQDNANLGGVIAVHQFTRIGAYSMTGGFSGIGQDIPPYTIASGPRAKLYGLNLLGLKRYGFSKETIEDLSKAYKILFRSKQTLKEAIKKAQEELPCTPELERLLEFVKTSKRGVCRPTTAKIPF